MADKTLNPVDNELILVFLRCLFIIISIVVIIVIFIITVVML